MPFIYEPIPEADKQRIDFEKQIKDVPQNPRVPDSWVIDRERNIYLVNYTMGGSQIDMPAVYGFGYKDLGVAWFKAHRKSNPENPNGRIYEVPFLFLGEPLIPYKSEILPLIRDAMIALARCDWASSSISVTVNFTN